MKHAILALLGAAAANWGFDPLAAAQLYKRPSVSRLSGKRHKASVRQHQRRAAQLKHIKAARRR